MIYGIDADRLTVWIEPFDDAVGYRGGVLCRRHADAMVVPLGWMLDDRREAVPRLFKPREAPAPAPVKSKSKRSKSSGRDETGQLELGVVPDELDDELEDRPAPDPEVMMGSRGATAPWKPVFDQNDDLDGLLAVESPLLSRAFGRRDRHDKD